MSRTAGQCPEFEQTTIQRLEGLGYRYVLGEDLEPATYDTVYEVAFLRDLIHEVVQTIKRNLKVDWTEPHRDDVKAAVRAAVRRVLRTREVNAEHFEPLIAVIMAQAEALYADWPQAA